MLQGTHTEEVAPHGDEGPIPYVGEHTAALCHSQHTPLPQGPAHRPPPLADSP